MNIIRFIAVAAAMGIIIFGAVSLAPNPHGGVPNAKAKECRLIQGSRGPRFAICDGARMSREAKACFSAAGIAVGSVAIGAGIAGATLRQLIGASIGGGAGACFAKLAD